MTPSEKRLRDFLLEPVSPVVHRALMSISDEAQAEAKRARGGLHFRRMRGKTLAVIAGVTLSGTVIAAAAIPFALDVLFPPPVSTSFTFESGVVCDVDIRVRPDFASSDNPEAAMDVAQKFISTLDVAALPVEQIPRNPSDKRSAAKEAADAAREAAGTEVPTENPYMEESEAVSKEVTAAIRAELADKDMQYGVSIETGTSCE